MTRLLVRSAAEADIADAAIWYEARAAGLGAEFLLALVSPWLRSSACPIVSRSSMASAAVPYSGAFRTPSSSSRPPR